MRRALYRCVVALHPRSFRQQFAGEMLWIFDEAAQGQSAFPLFADGIASLARQWIVRHGTWKVALALVAGLLHISIILGALSSVCASAK
jgi:hypothetical protein